jgi:hypothetical protein
MLVETCLRGIASHRHHRERKPPELRRCRPKSLFDVALRPCASLLLMNYPRRRRLKIYATITFVSPRDDAELLARVESFDWNCPQHITQRFTAEETEHHTAALHCRVVNGAGGAFSRANLKPASPVCAPSAVLPD